MANGEELARIAELLSQMTVDELIVFRALAIYTKASQRHWTVVDEAVIVDRLRNWITIGES